MRTSATPEPTATPVESRARLDRALVGGLAWSAAGRWLSQLARWAATVMTAWFLTPADYGIVGLTMLVVGFLQYFAEFGFGAAIVQQRSLPASIVRQIGGASVLIAAGLAVLMTLTAPVAARFFGQPALAALLPLMSIRLFIDAFAVVPRSVLLRDMEFRKLSLLEGLESILVAVITVGTAWVTRSYWALIVGNLTSGLAFVVGVTLVARNGPSIPRAFREIRSQMAFGWNVVVSRLAWYGYSNADFAIVGRVMNATVLGLYTFAWSIAALPAEKLSGLVLAVAPSIMSAARTVPGEMRRYYLLLLRGVALVTFPVAVGLALVSADLVHAVFGSKWEGAVVPLQLLALFFGVRSVATLAPVVMIASGEPKVDRNNSLAFLLVLPPLFLVATRWGLAAVAATWLIVYPALFAVLGQRWILKRLQIGVGEFFAEVWPAVASVSLMAAVVTITSGILDGAFPLVRLLVLSAVGAITYLAIVRTLFREVFDAALWTIRNRGVPGMPASAGAIGPEP
ncbi:MAG TPA: lipopolysaccharide biosynthesis protein [Gemmatimonadaceae bacterium]